MFYLFCVLSLCWLFCVCFSMKIICKSRQIYVSNRLIIFGRGHWIQNVHKLLKFIENMVHRMKLLEMHFIEPICCNRMDFWLKAILDRQLSANKQTGLIFIHIHNLNKYAANAKLMKSTKCMTDCTKTKRSCCHWLTIYDETSEHPFDCFLFTQNNWFNYILANAHALKSCLNHAYAYSMDFILFICVESFEKYSISLRPSVCWLFDICYSHAYQMIITYIVDFCIKYAWSAKNTTNHSR